MKQCHRRETEFLAEGFVARAQAGALTREIIDGLYTKVLLLKRSLNSIETLVELEFRCYP